MTMRLHGSAAPQMQAAIVSMLASLAAATTSPGRSSYRSPAAYSASRTVSPAISSSPNSLLGERYLTRRPGESRDPLFSNSEPDRRARPRPYGRNRNNGRQPSRMVAPCCWGRSYGTRPQEPDRADTAAALDLTA